MWNHFRNRAETGQLLAQKLTHYANRPDVLVLALPRGGVPVAREVAIGLNAPLDVLLVRKLGVPGHEELAMGAIAGGSDQVLNRDVIKSLRISDEIIDAAAARERRELNRRQLAYRDDLPAVEAKDRAVILVDDGVATGSTMCATISALRQMGAKWIVAATPVISRNTYYQIRTEADEFVALLIPNGFSAVGDWYEDFSQITDEEIRQILETSTHALA
jgi:putative phosphoribosyl transferase